MATHVNILAQSRIIGKIIYIRNVHKKLFHTENIPKILKTLFFLHSLISFITPFFLLSFRKYLLITQYVLGIVVDHGNKAASRHRNSCL